MVLYVDVFFFINFIFDFLIIAVAGRMGGVRFSWIRTLSGAAFGALYALAAFLFGGILESGAARLAFSFLAAFLSFGFYSVRRLIRMTAIFILCSAAAGGAAYSVALICGTAEGGTVYFDFPLIYSLSGIFALTVLAEAVISAIRSRGYEGVMRLTVIKDGRTYRLSALFDSGNRALDPLTKLPLIVSEDIFPESLKNSARPIYVNTAVGMGELRVFVPDKVIIRSMTIKNGVRVKKISEGNNAAIGIADCRLSADGSFNALIGGACFEGLKENNTYS